MTNPDKPGTPKRHLARWRHRPPVRLVVIAIAGLAVLYWFAHREDARVKTAQAARIACSCLHLAGRTLNQCRADLGPELGSVMLSEDVADRSVTASLPFFGSDVARYREGAGCLLDRWKD
ncbi:MAG: hypothetical protein N2423_08995 [Novosphingobium sp.]|nr:hypothetical protein [Novosphingobium sp.]